MKLFDERKKPKMTNHLTPPIPLSIEPTTDKAGLEKARDRDSKLYTHGDTLYLAGTSSFQDGWDDIKIPFNNTNQSIKYRDAVAVLKVNPDIMNVVGHSSVALELQKNFPDRNFKKQHLRSTSTLSNSNRQPLLELLRPCFNTRPRSSKLSQCGT